jgi:soluble lytic murein transglycosylase
LAAVLAHQWQWHHVAITTIAMTSHRADYGLRFATPFQDVVETNAESFAIDKVWIYGIIRRESAFKLDARSQVGASGLMQLMPATARQQAKKIGIGPPDANYLLTPEGNIRLGSSYLSDMLRQFDGVQALATAAYNAGPRRVEKWIPENKPMPMDAWIDSLPYTETREYVKAVMAYTTIFEWRLKESVTRLSERMGEQVPAK